jgi:glycosyltransferase involved in cell wall biosynthesis
MKIMTAMYTLKKGGAYDRFNMMLEAFLEKECRVHCLSLIPILINHPHYRNHVIALPMKARTGLVTKAAVLILFPFYLFCMGWREKVDLIVAFGPLYAFLLTLPKWVLKRPMVTFIRLETSFSSRWQNSSKPHGFLTRMVEYVGLWFSDRIVAVNTTIRDDVLRLLGRRRKVDVKVLPNNIPSVTEGVREDSLLTRRRFGISEKAKVIATAGVLTRRKNFEVLVKCFPKTGVNDLFLLIIGEGSTEADERYRNYLKELVETLNLEKRVFFTGWLTKKKLWRIFCASDLFVLPSRSEGMPNVLLEALGCGTPCLGSDIPGIRDILCHEVLMFDPLDEKAIADKVRRFFSDFQYSNDIISLCQERKNTFVFDWKERVFKMVTQRPFYRGEACPSR